MKLPDKYHGIGWLVLLLGVLPCVGWCFAVGDTVEAWCECRRLESRLTALGADAVRPAALASDGRELVLSGALLDSVRRAAEGHPVRVAGYEPCVTLRQDGVALHTAQVTLTGTYSALLQVADRLERSLSACRLRTTEWRTTADRKSRQAQLTLTLYIQQIVLNP